MVGVVGGFDTLDKRSLGGVDDVGAVPEKEMVGEGDALAGYDVAWSEAWIHGEAFDGNQEVGVGECGYDVALAF